MYLCMYISTICTYATMRQGLSSPAPSSTVSTLGAFKPNLLIPIKIPRFMSWKPGQRSYKSSLVARRTASMHKINRVSLHRLGTRAGIYPRIPMLSFGGPPSSIVDDGDALAFPRLSRGWPGGVFQWHAGTSYIDTCLHTSFRPKR